MLHVRALLSDAGRGFSFFQERRIRENRLDDDDAGFSRVSKTSFFWARCVRVLEVLDQDYFANVFFARGRVFKKRGRLLEIVAKSETDLP